MRWPDALVKIRHPPAPFALTCDWLR